MDKGTMKLLHMVSFVLLLVGGLNWGLIGLFGFNLVTMVFGTGMLSTLVYVLVGLAAVYVAVTHQKDCRICGGK